MEKLSINKLILFCILFFVFVSCGENTYKSITDANTENEVLTANIPPANISNIVHPGILNSDASLDFIDADYNNNSYRQQAYGKINTMISSLISYPNDFPETTVYVRNGTKPTPTEEQMWNDGLLAYGHALRWARTGNSNDATTAKYILNGWADTVNNSNFQIKVCSGTAAEDPQETGCCIDKDYPHNPLTPAQCPDPNDSTQRKLKAAWVAPNFAAAAEIIRYYNGGAGWSTSDINNFKSFLLKLNGNYIDDLVSGVINQPSSTWANNNWGASAAWAQMAIGVFVEDTEGSDIYEKGKYAITKNNGLIENIIDSSTGKPTETDRDCLHPQMSLTALTYAAETAKIQGDNSLYGSFGGSTLKKGWEWMSNNYGTGACNTQPDDKIMPGVDVAYNYYHRSNDIEDLHDEEEPYGVVTRQFIGFTTYTHYDILRPAKVTMTAINDVRNISTMWVKYPKSGGHSIYFDINPTEESIDGLLTKMRNAINADQNAEITAEIDLVDNTITFTEKTVGSFANSNKVEIDGTGSFYEPPFNPMEADMSGGID